MSYKIITTDKFTPNLSLYHDTSYKLHISTSNHYIVNKFFPLSDRW